MISNAELGRRIRAVRKARKMTGANLSAIIDREMLNERCTNIRSIDAGYGLNERRLSIICEALGITPADIYGADWRQLCQRGGISLEDPL